MNRGVRYRHQRANRARLKADCVVLLDRLAARLGDVLTDREARQIAEMRMRLAPPTGVKAPIILTDFSRAPRQSKHEECPRCHDTGHIAEGTLKGHSPCDRCQRPSHHAEADYPCDCPNGVCLPEALTNGGACRAGIKRERIKGEPV